MPTVSRAYWVFAALATEVYLIMYVLMFVAAARLRRREPGHQRGYRAPALVTICVVGSVASVAACAVGLLPPSQGAIASEQAIELANALAELPEGQLRAVTLHHFEGWTLEQVAEHLGRSPVAVAGLIKRGLATLRQHFQVERE